MTATLDPRTHFSFPFNYGDAAPRALMTCPAGVTVERVTLIVTAPFDGGGASVAVGDAGDPQRLLSAADVDLSPAGDADTFESAPAKRYPAATPILLSISPGSGPSSGSGVVTIDLTL